MPALTMLIAFGLGAGRWCKIGDWVHTHVHMDSVHFPTSFVHNLSFGILSLIISSVSDIICLSLCAPLWAENSL